MSNNGNVGKNGHGLTPRQEKYCYEKIVNEKTQTDAYMAAYECKNRKSAKESASRLNKLDFIQKRIAELQAQVDAGAILNLQQIQAEVANIAVDPESPKSIKLKAFDQLARMQGGYADNVNLHTTGTLGVSIQDKKDAIRSLLGEDNDA